MRKRAVLLAAILVLFIGIWAEKTIDQQIADLERELQKAAGKEKIEVLNQLAYKVYDQYPQKCLTYGKQALRLSQELEYKKGEGLALKHISMGYMVLGSNDQSLAYARKALNIFETIGDTNNAANTLTALGVIYMNLGQYDTSLKYYLQALKIAEKIGDEKEINKNLNNIGVLHFWQGNLAKALEYYQKSLKIEQELGNSKGISDCYNNIALIHHVNGKKEQAIRYYLKALKISKELDDKGGLLHTYMNLGDIYSLLKDFKKAEEYLSKSLQIAKAMGSDLLAARSTANVGAIYLREELYEKALKYLEEGLVLAKKIENKEIIKNTYINLAKLYEATGDHPEALKYHKFFFDTYKEIFNEKSSQQIADMQTRYETEKKEKEIEILEKNNEIQRLQLSRERITRNAFILSFFLVSIILVLLFRKYLYLFAFWKKEKYIGQFRLQDKIDSGGMGIIYRGHHIKDKSKPLAIKVLREELSQEEHVVKRFKQEATIIDKLNHPNIIEIVERGQYKQKLFIAMELLAGKSLDGKIAAEGPLDLRECLHIMIQVTDALALIHSKNIIHRDLKPSNIMLISRDGDENFVKLLDFGVARMRFQSKMTKTGMLVGTTSYLAPEQITNKGVSHASDIFSLGIIFYEMVCAKKPFNGQSDREIINEILDKTPSDPSKWRPDIPDGLNELIMKMLAKRKKPRPTSTTTLEALRALDKR